MTEKTIDFNVIGGFQHHLRKEEKSEVTIEKYIHDVMNFLSYVNGEDLTKEIVVEYKQHLLNKGYAIRSVNSMVASINSLFRYLGREDLKVKSMKIQQRIFCAEEKELTRPEYERLCWAAQKKNNERLYLILQTICSTGIRVGELLFITVEAVKNGKAEVSLKGKSRVILIPKDLQKKLLRYIENQKIKSGKVFVTRTGKALNRSNIWREMKGLCVEANVNPQKVFPHNLRHLFARIFYNLEKDIMKLADVLGHSNVNTTRIYIISTGSEHRQCMENMHLVI